MELWLKYTSLQLPYESQHRMQSVDQGINFIQ